MNMRRYSMKARRVTALKRLLRNDRIRITRVAIAAHEKKEDTVYVFFDNVEEEETKDKAVLEQLKEKAAEVSKDEVYPKLSNAKQRELHLLGNYGVSKREAVDVIELVKIAEVEAAVALDEKLLTARVKLEVEEQKEAPPKSKEGKRRNKKENKKDE